MTGTNYFLTEDDVRYFRGLENRILSLEKIVRETIPVGSIVDGRAPCRSPKWSDSRLEAVGDEWDFWYLMNDFNSSVVVDRSLEESKSGILAASSDAHLPELGQLGGLANDGGYSVYFKGSNNCRIDLPLLIPNKRGWTMEAVFKAESLPQNSLVLHNGVVGTNGYGIKIGDGAGGSGSKLSYVAGGTHIDTGITLVAEQWYDVIFIADTVSEKLFWYVSTFTNPEKEFSIISGSAAQAAPTTPATKATIGGSGATTFQFKGWVEEVVAADTQLVVTQTLQSAYDRLHTSLEPGPPPGFIRSDGTDIGRSRFANLFSAIGTSEGEGDGTTTFGIPNVNPSNALIKI